MISRDAMKRSSIERAFTAIALALMRWRLSPFTTVKRARWPGALRQVAALFIIVLGLAAGGMAAAAPPAPTPLGPVNGANVTVPATMSWSAVTDPSGAAIAGYNWRVSASPSMTPLVFADSTNGTTTQDTLSGLSPGSYFWQVQAAGSAGESSAWSPAQSFNVTGAGPGTPGTPVLAPTRGYSTFHPWESVHFSWSAVPGAPTYRLEVSSDPSFPLGTPGVVTFWNENIRATTDGFVHHPSLGEGTFYARVFATDSDFVGGIRSLPSNVIQYTVFYNNPIGPPPVLVSPVNGETLTLPVTLRWEHVPNPQASGYVWEVATDATFSNIEAFYNQSTEPFAVLPPLTPGPKFWRVLSQHGLSSFDPRTGASTNANTEWSATGRFTVSAAPAVPVAITTVGGALPQSVYGGPGRHVGVQLSGVAPAGGAAVAMTSSNPALVPVPATLTVAAGFAENSVAIPIGQVTAPTAVVLTATFNGASISRQLTVLPPTLNDDPFQANPTRATGGAAMFGYVDLEGGAFPGVAPAGGFIVNLSTNSPAAIVPNAVTIPAGSVGVGFPIQTSPVPTSTVVTITASAGGVTTQWPITLEAAAAPTSFFVRPMSTTSGSQGVVTAAEGTGFDQILQVTSSNPALAQVPSVVTVFAGSGVGFFDITTTPVTAQSIVTISVSGGGVTRSAALTLHPALPALTSLTVNPTTVAGGATATGTVRLASAAPAGGVAINLGSNLPRAASVPASVTVPAGATSATFTVTTFPSALTTVQLTAALNNVFQSAAITVGPSAPPPGPTLSAVSLTPTSVAGGTASTGRVTLSGAAPSGGAVVTLSDDSAATAVPSSVTVPAGASSASFTVTTSPVTAATAASISAVFGGVTRTAALTVNAPTSPPPPEAPSAPSAPTLLSPAADARPAQPVTFDWSDVANATSYEIQVDDSSTMTAPFRASRVVNVSQATIEGLPAQRLWWRVRAQNSAGVFGPFSSARRFEPRAATAPAAASLSSVSVNPASVVGPASSTGTASLTAPAPSGGVVVALASSNPAVAAVPASVTVPAGATSASFAVTTSAVAANTGVTLTGTYNGTSRTASLTVTPAAAPPPPASLATLALNPGNVTGGGTSQASVTLTGPAPAGGAVVALSDNSTAAAVPASVTVPAGASSASFTVTTSPVTAATAATISAVLGAVTRTAVLTVNPPGTNAALTVSASGRSGERITSSPAGISVTVGSSGSASFATGTSITLNASNGRDVIWSGACSSGGNKTRTCTLTINGNASVSANVQ
ncbi:hypothetical protein EZ313_19760 [Ramlibacter henchirensis]|uniref:Fibronectin type-III domain-containing protein n=1 Tax=Ramlibacter henchirensis TaxID=204072 RepID=A0A4Z0BN07_9BURK|nr:hypothetical protein [Ramlibacter henchirensis]TFZ00687.1 hypothetical protein EZ313_19760 [Ramlibacter henchirensis]